MIRPTARRRGDEPGSGQLGHAPMLTIFGGKITTFRKLAEHALDKLSPYFPKMGDAWTSTQPLPHTLYEVEPRYLVENDLAQTAKDIQQRRSKCRLHLKLAERKVFSRWLDTEFPQANALSA